MALKKYNEEIVRYFIDNSFENFSLKKEEWKYEPMFNFLVYLSGGSTIEAAAVMSGISESQVHAWKAEGDISYHSEFSEAIKKAIYYFEQSNVNKIRNNQSWQSAAWLLERIFPDRYKQRVENTNNNTDTTALAKLLDEAERNRAKSESKSNKKANKEVGTESLIKKEKNESNTNNTTKNS